MDRQRGIRVTARPRRKEHAAGSGVEGEVAVALHHCTAVEVPSGVALPDDLIAERLEDEVVIPLDQQLELPVRRESERTAVEPVPEGSCAEGTEVGKRPQDFGGPLWPRRFTKV